MKFCENCGSELSEGAKFCSSCGKSTKNEVVEEKETFFKGFDEEESKNNSYSYMNSYAQIRGKNYSTSTLTGILSVILSLLNYLGLPFVHLIGIIMGVITLVLVEKDKYELKQHSKVGFVTGIIGIVLGVLAIVVGIVIGILFPELYM